GERVPERRDVEERVVAEPAGAAGRGRDLAAARPQAGDGAAVREGEHGGADVARSPRLPGDAAEPLEQDEVVGLVQVPATEVGAAGKALGADAGRAAQRIDAQAGVVGEDGERGEAGEVPRLGRGVFLE